MSYPNFRRISIVNDKELCASVLMYLPFMVAVPQLSYQYGLVCILPMLPVVSWFWENTVSPAAKIILAFSTVGIALSQFQAVAAEKLIGTVHPHFIPGFGERFILSDRGY